MKQRELAWPRLVFCALICAALSACSGHPPEILRVGFLALNVRDPAGGSPAWYAAVFAQVEEPDGWEDLEVMYVIHDEERLYWSLAGQDLERKKKGNELWIGSSGLVMPDRRPFPRGVYRLQVRDFSGRRHEANVYHSPPAVEPVQADFPAVRSNADALTYIFYASDGRVAGEVSPRPPGPTQNTQPQPAQPAPAARPAPPASMGPPAGAANFFIFKYDAQNRIGLASGPWAVSEYAPADRQK